MAARPFAKTWWGSFWVDRLESLYIDDQMIQGKRYAKKGNVYGIEIDDNVVSAKVKGKYRHHYNVNIGFEVFSKEDIDIILDTVYENPLIFSKLLNHELSPELVDKLFLKNVNIFPFYFNYIPSTCDCFSWDPFCKHKVALFYALALEIDKDPFLIFKLQGCDLLELLNYNDDFNKIRSGEDIFSNIDNQVYDLDELDFSKIPFLLDNIFNLLKDNPIFYKKDFKKILKSVYKGLSKFLRKKVSIYSRHSDLNKYNSFLDEDIEEEFTVDEEDYDEWLENIFLNKWNMPNKWQKFNINVNKNYDISSLKVNVNDYVKDVSEKKLFEFFTELSESQIDKFNPNIQFLNLIYQFSLELIKKQSFIPELFESSGYYNIRWIPAIFDKNISSIIDRLVVDCPDNLIKFKNRKVSRKDQVITAVSLFIKGFLDIYLEKGSTKTLLKNYDEDIFQLFFVKSLKSNKLGSNVLSINQWLSKFILNSRNYDLYLVIEEDDEKFNINVKVNDDMENIEDLINNTNDNTLKINLLRDLNLISEIYPKFSISTHLNQDIIFTLDEFSEFFFNVLPLFELMGINIVLPKALQKIFKPNLNLNISSNQNVDSFIKFNEIIDFNWQVALGNSNYSLEEFKHLSEEVQGLVKIANDYVILNENDVKDIIRQINKLPEKLNKHDLMKAMLSGEYMEAEVNIDNELQKMIDDIVHFDSVEIPDSISVDLRAYQKTGYYWLVQNIKTGFGSILADDMGLGKTLQVLTTIQHFKDEGYLKKEKVLVIAPTSLLTNWQKEIEKFTPNLTSFIYHGSNRVFSDEEYDIYLTSYGVVRRDIDEFRGKKWFLCIVDEAQNIKNPRAKQTIAVKDIKSKHRIAMSGTPVENRLSEYWSIFDFINKGYLNNLKRFRENYIVPIEKEMNLNVLNNFKQITSPFILRRLKNDKNIIGDLPDKIVNDIYSNLTQNQVALYKETLDSAINEIQNSVGIKRKGVVLKLINSLKQICNHPSQFTKSKSFTIEESGKMKLLINILENILDSNEKVLIFTQYVHMGEIIQKLVEEKFNTEVLFLKGSLSRAKRDDMIERFNENSQNKIFIISLKAGGTGLNLTSASNVIHYDLWWNPAVENQATDRAYRIGQTNNVMVHRFITQGTFEEKINEMIYEKEELADLTVGSGETFITEMSNDDLKEMLILRQ